MPTTDQSERAGQSMDSSADAMTLSGVRVINPSRGKDTIESVVLPAGAAEGLSDSRSGSGLILCPGFIDLYARLREPGPSRKGTLASEARAALAAGFTRVCCSPDTQPVIDDTATVQLVRYAANAAHQAEVHPLAAMTSELQGELLSELATLKAAGCVAATQADTPISDPRVMISVMEYAASFDIPLIITPMEASLAQPGGVHAGAVASRLGLPGMPVVAETIALARLLELSWHTGCRLHISRLSSARSVDMLANARSQGLSITADVGLSHLYFTDTQVDGFDVDFHSAVPFRSASDRAALREGFKHGIIDAVCSDHAPHDADARLAPFASSEPGLATYDAFMPMLLALPDLLGMSMLDVIARVTTGPAQTLGWPAPDLDHTLKTGYGHCVLIDPRVDARFDENSQFSAGNNSPLAGNTVVPDDTGESVPLLGKSRLVMMDGEVRFSNPA